MILLIESILIQSMLLFMIVFQWSWEMSCCWSVSSEPTGASSTKTDDTKIYEELREHLLSLRGNEKTETAESIHQVSILTIEQDSFFTDFASSLLDEKETEEVEMIVSEQPKSEPEDDMLSMEAWSPEPEPVTVSSKLSASANAKISEQRLGEQLWVVEVVGEEQGYLHVSDGSGRAWINFNGFGNFSRRDILSVLVNRENDLRLNLIDADLLQQFSTEFSMADELHDSSYAYEEDTLIA